MNKEETITRYGEGAYERRIEQNRQWRLNNLGRSREIQRNWRLRNSEKVRETRRNWVLRNPEKVKEKNRKHNEKRISKAGKFYLKNQRYRTTGIQGERNRIRGRHAYKWREYKKHIAPYSEVHHAWRAGTAEYDGVALVEKNAHRHGIIDVIQILDGEITVLTEAELKAK